MKRLIAAGWFPGAGAIRAQTATADCVIQNGQTGMYTAYFGDAGNNNPPATIPAGPREFRFRAKRHGRAKRGYIPMTGENSRGRCSRVCGGSAPQGRSGPRHRPWIAWF